MPLELFYQVALLKLLEYLLRASILKRLELQIRMADVVHGQLRVAAARALQELLLLLNAVHVLEMLLHLLYFRIQIGNGRCEDRLILHECGTFVDVLQLQGSVSAGRHVVHVVY